MNKLNRLIILLTFFPLLICAEEFTIHSFAKDIPIEKLNGEYVEPLSFSEEGYLDPESRDFFLEKSFASEIVEWDNFERDMLYKKLLHYSKEDVLSRYSFISEENYEVIFKELRNLPGHAHFFQAREPNSLKSKKSNKIKKLKKSTQKDKPKLKK